MGQPITWVTPYKFAQKTPTDVDFRIMDTFLHFYTTLVGFVNCRLYTTLNLRYPPKVDVARAKDDAGMSAFVLEKTTNGEAAAAQPASQETLFGEKIATASAKQVKNLSKVIGKIEATVFAEEGGEDGAGAAAAAGASGSLDSFPEQMAGGEDTVAEIAAASGEASEAEEFEKLFEGKWFFLGREVPKVRCAFLGQKFTLEDAIGSHACSLEALACV
jgi:pescadillo protein